LRLVLARAEVELLLVALLPHAATSAAIANAASAVRATRGVCRMVVIGVLSRAIDQPPLPDPNSEPTAEPEPDPLPVRLALALLAPESLIDVAARVPFLFLSPRITTESPGCSDRFETLRLLVILVAEESVTLTVLPEPSVR
jgi:hypothetical protein